MNIRRATPADYLTITALDRVAWDTLEYPEKLADGEHTWRIWVEHALVWVAEEASEIIGVLLAFPTQEDNHYCLHKIFVAKTGRGKGVGRALFDSFLKYSNEHSLSSFLTVAPFNENAIALYEKMGFVKSEYVEGYYRPDEHRWVMEYQPTVSNR